MKNFRVWKIAFVCSLLLAGNASVVVESCTAQSLHPPLSHSSDRMFLFDLLQFQTDPPAHDSLRLDVYLAVPYNVISFQYAVDKYIADYGVILQVTDLGAGAEKVVVDKYQSYSLARSTSEWGAYSNAAVDRADASQYSLTLATDHEYQIRLAVRDLSNQRELDTTFHFHTRTFSGMGTSLSDLMIYRSRKGYQLLPNIGSDVSTLPPDESGLFAELYDAPKATYGVLARLLDASATTPGAQPDELARWSSPLITNGEKRIPIFQNLSMPDLWMGQYKLELYLFSNPNDTVLRSTDSLQMRAALSAFRMVQENVQRGIPLRGSDIDEAVEQVEIIATNGELDSLHAAKTPLDKRRALVNFWHRRKASPNDGMNRQMDVFYRRLQYADETYGGTTHGWRSDRGRLYIALGAPTNVDRHPYDVNEKPYEVWYYNDLNTRYVFVDEYMLGDYRLASAPAPYGVFLWQRDSY